MDESAWKIATAIFALVAASVGTSAASYASAEKAEDKQAGVANKAAEAQRQEKAKLETAAAAAPEEERVAQLEQRRRRARTLLSDQEETGMATVGRATLLGE